MNNTRRWSKLLLWLHLIVCLVWLSIFQAESEHPSWMWHVFVWSLLGIQFTWGFTVGLIVGPNRQRRPLLWWSLLTVFMPVYYVGGLVKIMGLIFGPLVALIYLAVFVTILACETFGGVLLGVKAHSQDKEE